MPEPENTEDDKTPSDKPSKILQFFSTPVKEQRKEKVKPLSKVVIRRLPPRLSKEDFLKEFTLPPHDYFYFVRGDLNLVGYAFSRAYVNITNPDDIFAFREKYDDHSIQDELGREYHAVVEWAPQQRIPKKTSQKKSSKSGTLETDPKYVEFLEKLEQEKNSPANTSEYFMETDSVTTKEVKVTTTPLLEYIKLKRQQKIDIRNENRIRKREAEKEKRRKEDDMRRTEKHRKEKEKPIHKEGKDGKIPEEEVSKTPVKDVVEKKKSEPKSPRIAKPETKPREEKFEKRPKVVRKPESEAKSLREDRTTPKPVSSRKAVPKEEKVASSDGNHRPSVESKKEPRSSEPKSKFRYSEQRNRDRNQKVAVEPKTAEVESAKEKDGEDGKEKVAEVPLSRQSTQESDGSVDGEENRAEGGSGRRKDPRVERKIRNKDRPSMEIYRPGMGRFSKQKIDVKKDEPESVEVRREDAREEAKPEKLKDNDIRPFRIKETKILDNPDLKSGQKSPVAKKSDDGVKSVEVTKDEVSKLSEEIKSDISMPGEEIKGEVVKPAEEITADEVVNPSEGIRDGISKPDDEITDEVAIPSREIRDEVTEPTEEIIADVVKPSEEIRAEVPMPVEEITEKEDSEKSTDAETTKSDNPRESDVLGEDKQSITVANTADVITSDQTVFEDSVDDKRESAAVAPEETKIDHNNEETPKTSANRDSTSIDANDLENEVD